MRTPCCHSFLAFILKFLNFLQAFVGVAIIVYSSYLLNQWNHHHHQFPPPHESGGAPLPAGVISPPNFAYGVFSQHDGALGFDVNSLPAPCFEVGLVAFIALDHNWEKDIPFDSTGELDNFRTFIQDNVDVFMWVGIAIVVIQVLCLLLAIVLRSLVSGPSEDDDLEGDYDYRSSNREPLLAPYSNQASVSARGDSDIWSSRMRNKYGLNSADVKTTSLNQNPSIDAKQ
ncbi:hypothetical protein CASFOL_008654 [Castilleja foliolosa]|uniref:Uncharacterized protein n=1 Tax=Castilleja foliolosa TaxID=1961234 RepID=A0ABD3E0R6_9LAMI